MKRLTARAKNGLAYLVNVKPDEQEVDSPHKNTLQCILDCFERLAQYEDAEGQGRLVVLPCKVGDTVYVVAQERLQDMKKTANEQPKPFLAVREHTISTIVINNTGVRAFANSYCFYLGEFGKTVFLTRAEAEAALAKEE